MEDRASERLIELGLAAAGPTAIAGANDWADAEAADDRVRRVGAVHAMGNVVAASLYAASLAARRGGARRLGRALGLGGAAVLATGAYLGGHLTFSRGVGPAQTVYDLGPTEWTPVEAGELREGEPTRLVAGDTPVLAVRRGERVLAIHDRCSHRGCSLSEGELHGDEIRCACHGSRFDLRDGALRDGPATAAQPVFEVREVAGRLEVKLAAS